MVNKLLFFDIDGTLVECNLGIYSIPSNTREALDKLVDTNNSVFLATGRCKCFILDGVYDYPFSGYVTCNGAYVEYKGKEIFKSVLPKDVLQIVHDYCLKNNLTYYFEGNDYIYVLDKSHPTHLVFKENWEMKDEIVKEDYDINDIETYIGMIVLNDENQEADMIKALSPYFDIQRHLSGLSYDLTQKNISKATGIQKLVEALNKDISDTIAFGDGNNDIEMLEAVGLGIAMGNACKNAKEASDYVTSNVEKDGIIEALKHFNLI